MVVVRNRGWREVLVLVTGRGMDNEVDGGEEGHFELESTFAGQRGLDPRRRSASARTLTSEQIDGNDYTICKSIKINNRDDGSVYKVVTSIYGGT